MAKKQLTDGDYRRLATESNPVRTAVKVRKMGYSFNMNKLMFWKRKNSGGSSNGGSNNTNNNPEEG